MLRKLARVAFRNRRLSCARLSTKRQYLSYPQFRRKQQAVPAVLFASFGVAYCLSTTKRDTDEASLVNKANELYESGLWHQIYDLLLPYCNTTNPDILWRLARAARDVSQLSDTQKNDKKRLVYEALEYATRAVEYGPNNFACHKWCGIALSDVGDYEGTKAKITNAYVIRDHFLKAIELNPNDSTSRYLLGKWCFTLAEMPWYQHKIAAALFATPPSSTYEEALKHFELAEKNNPDFYCDNKLMLGKTHLRLGHKQEAKQWLTKTVAYNVYRPEDKQSQDEARQLLRSL
ncbi:regulator of microtubule dynamics protein 1-like isoform X2 [Corticium candelabrum]|uniref:regulator of microtubule dynamics protein 1-like isoform X2 n=1 Tax=Corticium candelabrum TaxID=121492 RepID=UPI002E2681A2|nr:regulator of microtubule dynamics protein 1-like isoform X2 [Corticium candelabrum]